MTSRMQNKTCALVNTSCKDDATLHQNGLQLDQFDFLQENYVQLLNIEMVGKNALCYTFLHNKCSAGESNTPWCKHSTRSWQGLSSLQNPGFGLAR